MDMGAVIDAAAVQVQHFAGETVLDAVNALAGADKAPLLPLLVGVVPQLDLGAVVHVIVSDLHDLAVGGADGIELILRDHGLSDFLGSHCMFSS